MPTLPELIEKLGGKLATAYKAQVSVQTVYGWEKTGRVGQAAPAVRLARAAAEEGIHVTVAHLAGVDRARKPTGTDAPRIRRAADATVATNGEAPEAQAVRPGEAAATLRPERPRKQYGYATARRRGSTAPETSCYRFRDAA